MIVGKSLVSSAEESQKEQEKIDKIEVERKCSHDGVLAGGLMTGDHLRTHIFQLLHIPGGESGEYQHTDKADQVLHSFTFQEEVDQAGNNDPNQRHHEDAAEFGEVGFCSISGNRHDAKCQ